MSTKFTEDWFSSNIPTWTRVLSKLKNKPVSFLEIGTFEGRSAVWVLENILTHPDSKLYVVDHWLAKGKHNQGPFQTFKDNIEPYKSKVHILKGFSRDMLRNLKHAMFDFVYLDASKHSQNVLEDAVLAYPLLKPNGIMIFDDYTYNKEHDVSCPRHAIDAFINIYVEEIQVLQTRWQVIIKKRTKPLPRRPCYSEFFTDPKTTPEEYKHINKYR